MENVYKKKKEPERNKQLILDTAAEIGAASDWHQVTFQAIADKTGLSKGGIIHHFRSKEELLDEMVHQSLTELTKWISEEKKAAKSEDASIAYLRFVIKKSNDEKYRKTMKVIMQSILVDQRYHTLWKDWFANNIIKVNSTKTDINSLIITLVADGLWFSDNLGIYGINDKTRKKILNKLRSKGVEK